MNEVNQLLDFEFPKGIDETDIPIKYLEKLDLLLSSTEIDTTNKIYYSLQNKEKVSYEFLNLATINMEHITKKFKDIVREIDIELFVSGGYRLDIDELKERFKKRNLKAKFPNFNFDKLAEFYSNPPKYIINYEKEHIEVDEYVWRKYIIVLVQMVFNHMDFLGCFVGPEGSGKSTLCSQHIFLVYYLIKELGIREYEFNIKEIMFNTLDSFMEAEDKFFKDPFRILALDEGNELNRQNWKDEKVQMFFQRLRRERYQQRIKFVNLPVLGELSTNVVLARVNFVFETVMANKVKSGMLEKGLAKLYIIPRADEIYSPQQKRNLKKDDIKQTLYENLKDKSYLKGIPQELLVKEITFNEVMGFKEEEYTKNLKDTNETFTINKGMNFTELQLYMLYTANITMRKLGIKQNDHRRSTLNRIFLSINKYFESRPELIDKYAKVLARKQGLINENG